MQTLLHIYSMALQTLTRMWARTARAQLGTTQIRCRHNVDAAYSKIQKHTQPGVWLQVWSVKAQGLFVFTLLHLLCEGGTAVQI